MKVKNPYRIVNLKNPRHEYSLNDTENHKYKQKILMTKILTNKKIQLLHTKHVITVINLLSYPADTVLAVLDDQIM